MTDDSLNDIAKALSTYRNQHEDESKSNELAILKKILNERIHSESRSLSAEEKLDILKKRYQSFSQVTEFKEGDLVQWKPGLSNKGGLETGDIGIVIATLDPPVHDESKDAGNPYFREPLSLEVAFLDRDNDFMIIHLDGRRLQKVSL